MNGQSNKPPHFLMGVLAFSTILATACHKEGTQKTSVASPLAATPERKSELSSEVKQALASQGCPEWLAEAAMMKPNDKMMDCASLRTGSPAWAFWYWQDIGNDESRRFGDEQFALTRTIVDASSKEIQVRLGAGSQGHSDTFSHQHAYGKGPNRIDVVDIDGDGVDEILETVSGGQQGIYWNEHLLVRVDAPSTLRFVEVPVAGFIVMDFSSDDEGETVCSGELKIDKSKKVSQLVFTSSLFISDSPDASECPQPQHLRLKLKGSQITTQSVVALSNNKPLVSQAQCILDGDCQCDTNSDCNKGESCEIEPACDTCDGGGTFCGPSR